MSGGRVLFVSGSLGLGHATRDLAVARELRQRMPSIEIDWLCASPTSEMLAGAGELLAPECRDYRCETDTADAQGTADRLNLTAYVYRALLNWIHNARVIGRAVRRGGYDVLVGDETYEIVVAHVLGVATMPAITFIMLYDFWGMDIARGGLFERIGAWGLNAIWAQQHRVTGRGNSAALFIGEPADIPGSTIRHPASAASPLRRTACHLPRVRADLRPSEAALETAASHRTRLRPRTPRDLHRRRHSHRSRPARTLRQSVPASCRPVAGSSAGPRLRPPHRSRGSRCTRRRREAGHGTRTLPAPGSGGPRRHPGRWHDNDRTHGPGHTLSFLPGGSASRAGGDHRHPDFPASGRGQDEPARHNAGTACRGNHGACRKRVSTQRNPLRRRRSSCRDHPGATRSHQSRLTRACIRHSYLSARETCPDSILPARRTRRRIRLGGGPCPSGDQRRLQADLRTGERLGDRASQLRLFGVLLECIRLQFPAPRLRCSARSG